METSPTECPTCGSAAALHSAGSRSYVYAIGRLEARFPRQSIEKEFMQATNRTDVKNLTDRQTLHAVLSAPENRYLLRQMCWVMTIQGLETYIVAPTEPGGFGLLLETVRPRPNALDLDVVIGMRGK